jgi:hypothetical protein
MKEINNLNDVNKSNIKLKERTKKITVGEELAEKIKNIQDKCNQKEFGEAITPADIVSHMVDLIKEKDIKSIQEKSYTLKDRIAAEHRKYNLKNALEYSLDEFLAMKLKIQ